MATDSSSLLLLLNWMSPTFPIGAFAYSHGLEQAIADGRLRDAAAVEQWIADLIRRGSGWNDAVLFAQCWAADTEDLNEMALALAGSRERYQETVDLGRNFSLAAAVWMDAPPAEGAVAYAIAAGKACCAMKVEREQAVLAFLQGYCAALVSVAVRLVPLGQTAGLVLLRNLSPIIQDTAQRAMRAGLAELGSCCFAAEIAAMRHETLEPRVFRT